MSEGNVTCISLKLYKHTLQRIKQARTEALQGGFRARGEWGKIYQGAGRMGSKRPGSREQRKVFKAAGIREQSFLGIS